METKEMRLERQRKQFNKLLREIKKSVASSYLMKVQHDAYFIDHHIKEEVLLT